MKADLFVVFIYGKEREHQEDHEVDGWTIL
jgi:hypothetical protein